MPEINRTGISPESENCYCHPEIKSATNCFGCGKPVCARCVTISQGRIYCPSCYAVVETTNAEVTDRVRKKKKWYYSVPFVLLMLFAVAGPFAIPLLWGSPKFRITSKIILTILVIIYTIILIWLTYKIILMLIPQYRDLMQILRP
ncbi:MAG: hypothetical protein QME64_04435 [bacterium]|nr:hypothetical protein [bacterium]